MQGGCPIACHVKQIEGKASVSNLFSKLFNKAGVDGAVAQSARRTIAVKLKRQGKDERVIAELLGISSLANVRRLCMGDTPNLRSIVANVI